jgi:hypothetical protein
MVEQQSNLLETLTQGVYEQSNEYKIFTNDGQYLFNAKEESKCCSRMLCHPNHDLKIHIQFPTITNNNNQNNQNNNNANNNTTDLFTIIKPFKCCCCAFCVCCQKEITIRQSQPDDVI